MTNEKDKAAWHEAYKRRIIFFTRMTEEEAQKVLEAGMDDFDYEDDPEEAADSEMSYWGD